MPASAIDRFPANRRNELMEKISRNARRLRGTSNGSFQNTLALRGRSDAREQLLIKLGVIPIISVPPTVSLTATVMTDPPDRSLATAAETITVTGGTATQAFAAPNPAAVAVPFTAGGNGQVVTATDSLDTAAKGRALVDVLP